MLATVLRRALALGILPLFAGCAMHSTATQWNGHVGPNGEPVFVLSSTYLGLHLVGVVPFIGDTTIDEMITDSTQWIRAGEGSHLRLVETESNNFWYGLPPLSWFISPVMTSVTIEYKPSAAALARAAGESRESAESSSAAPQR